MTADYTKWGYPTNNTVIDRRELVQSLLYYAVATEATAEGLILQLQKGMCFSAEGYLILI